MSDILKCAIEIGKLLKNPHITDEMKEMVLCYEHVQGWQMTAREKKEGIKAVHEKCGFKYCEQMVKLKDHRFKKFEAMMEESGGIAVEQIMDCSYPNCSVMHFLMVHDLECRRRCGCMMDWEEFKNDPQLFFEKYNLKVELYEEVKKEEKKEENEEKSENKVGKEATLVQSEDKGKLEKQNQMLLELVENLNKVVTESFKKIQAQEQQISDLKENQEKLLKENEDLRNENNMEGKEFMDFVKKLEVKLAEHTEAMNEENLRSVEDLGDNVPDEDESMEDQNDDDNYSDDKKDDNGDNVVEANGLSEGKGTEKEVEVEESSESEANNTVAKKQTRDTVLKPFEPFVIIHLTLAFGYCLFYLFAFLSFVLF